jgi:serine/threonine protein kinase
MSKDPVCPPEWPLEAFEIYKPVKLLGKGGFGSVLKAHLREPKPNDPDEYVAIKAIAGGNCNDDDVMSKEEGYAQREVAVLRELSHPHMLRLVRYFQSDAKICIALSMAQGPTLEQLINSRGAPGIPFCRCITAQMIDVISFLHSRAVIHRDIKPDNIIVSHALILDEATWSNDLDIIGDKMKKWHATLIDFGLARPLGPDQIKDDIGLYNTVYNVSNMPPENEDPKFGVSLDHALVESSNRRGRKNSGESLNQSISQQRVRNLSAVGNRTYAAPEIIKGVRAYKRRDSLSKSLSKSMRGRKKQAEPLAKNVSDYGMNADAYSLGATVRHLLTGIPPDMGYDEFMSQRSSALKSISKMFRKKKKDAKPKNVYRRNKDLPMEAIRLVRGLTHWDPRKRTTVRAARSFPWVLDLLSIEKHDVEQEEGGHVTFLDCAPAKVVKSAPVIITSD